MILPFYGKMILRNNPWLLTTAWKNRNYLFALNAMQKHELRRLVQPGDDIVIDGYPRSANSFAGHAFAHAQARPVVFANHFHSPVQFLRARRLEIPAMLVLREPRAAALSWITFHDGALNAEMALRFYVHFHRPLLKITNSFVVAPFDEVISDFGRSIDRLNARFGTHFARFQHDEAQERLIFDRMAELLSRRDQALRRAFSPLRLHFPDPRKTERRSEIAGLFERPSVAGLLATARAQYASLRSLAGDAGHARAPLRRIQSPSPLAQSPARQ